MDIFIRPLFALIISFLITFYLVPLLCKLATRLRAIDIPDGDIKRHAQPTPYFGGIAIFAGFITALALTLPLNNQFCLLIIGSTLLLILGVIDDLIVLKPYQKFFGQIIAALCFLKGGLYLKEQFIITVWPYAIPLSFFWILSIINAFNLVDIMDGLATVISAAATINFLILACLMHQLELVVLLCAFLGPLCAFFWYNKPLAKIYLGDAGSLFIGGFLSTTPFLFPWGNYHVFGFLVPLIILAIPALEITTLVIIRSIKKIPFYHASPDHFALYLRAQNWQIPQILLFCLFLSVILGLTSILFLFHILNLAGLICCGVFFIFLWFATIFKKKGWR